jgi:HEXXH motif-containing protein
MAGHDTATPAVEAPWRWLADLEPWLNILERRAASWTPTVTVESTGPLAELVASAARAGAPWLYHPCVGAITYDRPEGRAARETAFVAYLASHADVDGALTLDEPVMCWSSDGGFLLEAGRHGFDALRAASPNAGGPEIALDPWSLVPGHPFPDSIAAGDKSDSEQEAEVRRSALVGLRAQAVARAYLPDVADWLSSIAKVLVFLDGSANLSRSASVEQLPGAVFADAVSEIALLEVLVHESAHHVLYLTEAGSPLIDPGERRRFSSPLRPDPRPLRGILLAYHALAFICAFYDDLAASELGPETVSSDDRASLRRKLADAEATLDGAAESLTDQGRAFMAMTRDVARYGG